MDSSPLVKRWTKKHGLKLKYKVRGRGHRYNPDILVEYHDGRRFLEEVKGKVWDRMSFGMKNLAAMYYCMMNGMKFRIIFREQLERVD